MTNKPLRNHPSVIIEKTVSMLFVLIFIFITALEYSEYMVYIFLLMLVVVAVAYVIWKKTYIIFNDDELVIERNLLIKAKKTIPYYKIASISVERKILNRIFGTSALKISINSGVNSMVPEAILTFKEDIALKVRDELSAKLFNQTSSVEEDEEPEPLIIFTVGDVIVHSIFGMPTFQSILAAFFLLVSIASIFSEGSGVAISLLIFAALEIIPSIFNIIKFYNFKVYRKDDAIHLQHGMIQNYRFSFKISRINAVNIKQTLFARLLNKASIEVEVVGLSDSDGKSPTVCLLVNKNKIPAIMEHLLPEYIYEEHRVKQPQSAKLPLFVNAAIYSVIYAIAFAGVWYAININVDAEHNTIVFYAVLALIVAGILLFFAAAHLAYHIREFDMGKDLFTFINGIVDRKISIVDYDRVQVIELASGPVARKVNLSVCKISLLSSMGKMDIKSGYFPTEDLSLIANRIMERISTGEFKSLDSCF